MARDSGRCRSHASWTCRPNESTKAGRSDVPTGFSYLSSFALYFSRYVPSRFAIATPASMYMITYTITR